MASDFAKGLDGGELIALVGELGAGKTQFVKGLARGLGVEDEEIVTSPTFKLVNLYNEGGMEMPLYHVDAYRLTRGSEAWDLGLEEAIEAGAVAAVEWADRLADLPARADAVVSMEVTGESTRRINIKRTERKHGENTGNLK